MLTTSGGKPLILLQFVIFKNLIALSRSNEIQKTLGGRRADESWKKDINPVKHDNRRAFDIEVASERL